MQLQYPVILASQSPRRKELLANLGVEFEIKASNVEEVFPNEMSLIEVPLYLAALKGISIAEQYDKHIVIAADTVVILNDKLLGKPETVEESRDFLKMLSGKSHKVITGLYVKSPLLVDQISVTSEVTIADLNLDEIDHYIHTCHPFDKAGGYGIQDWLGMAKVSAIKGSYTNIVGLPTQQLYDILLKYLMPIV